MIYSAGQKINKWNKVTQLEHMSLFFFYHGEENHVRIKLPSKTKQRNLCLREFDSDESSSSDETELVHSWNNVQVFMPLDCKQLS